MTTVTPIFRLNLVAFDTQPWDVAVNANFSSIDGVLNRFLAMPQYQGVWTNSTAYTVGQQVVDSATSAQYSCLVNNTSAASPTTFATDRTNNPSFWQLIVDAATNAASAATSATNAATSNTNAATSAASASASATSAGISATSATASAASAASSATTAANATTTLRNAVMNGGFGIAQRGTVVSLGAGSGYTADRWHLSRDGSGGTTTATITTSTAQSVLDSGLGSFMSLVTAGSPVGETFLQFLHDIEGVVTLSGQQVTLSFWAWADSSRSGFATFLSQNFGTGGSPSSSVNTTSMPFSLTTTPTKFSFTWTLGSIAGTTRGSNGDSRLIVVLQLPLNTAHTFNVTGVQLEAGSAATPFEIRPLGMERALCQRYFYSGNAVSWGYNAAGATSATAIPLPATLRSSTVTIVKGTPATNVNLTANSISLFDTSTAEIVLTITALGAYAYTNTFTVSADY